MADTVEYVQARNVLRCVITASGNMQTLVIAALNAQVAGRGDAIASRIIGARVLTASSSVTVSNVGGTGTLTVSSAPYDCPAVNWMAQTVLGGGATLGVEVYFTGVGSDIP